MNSTRTGSFLFSILIVGISFFFLMAIGTSAQSCDGVFRSVRNGVLEAELGSPLEENVIEKLNSAAARYIRVGRKTKIYANRDLMAARSYIETSIVISGELKASIQLRLIDLAGCITADNRAEGSLAIGVREMNGTTPVANSPIQVNGFAVGNTDANGNLSIPVRAGELEVEAAGSNVVGVTVAPGEQKAVTIVLDDSSNSYLDATAALLESSSGILDSNFSAFTLRMLNGSQPIVLTRLSELTLIDSPDTGTGSSQRIYLQDTFTADAMGNIRPTNFATFRSNIVNRTGLLRIFLVGEDATGTEYRATLDFQIGRYQVNVQFQAPPSAPTLSVSQVLVTVKFTPGNVIFRLISAANGTVTLPKMPAGVFEVNGVKNQAGNFYYGTGVSPVSSNFLIQVKLLGTTDQINNVPPFTITAQRPDPDATQIGEINYVAAERFYSPKSRFGELFQRSRLFAPASPAEVNILAVSAAQGVPVSSSATLNIPQGTASVQLKYNIQTDEYPTYVLPQSIYDDIWSLQVRASSGQQLFAISRRVNEQVTREPRWQADGTTGDLIQDINVSGLTANGPANLTVIGTSTNVADSALPTRVSACLGCSLVTINSVEPDDNVLRNISGKSVRGRSEFYSIPRPMTQNVRDRFFKLTLTKPQGIVIQRVRTQIVSESRIVLGTVFDEPATNTDRITFLNDNTVRVRVTYRPNQSSIVTDPPPTAHISYRFLVTVSGTAQPLPKDSGAVRPLWRMTTTTSRYGFRDPGFDDWVTQRTYQWISNNSSIVNYVDDTSGEHAVDIGHSSHNTGEDIDTYHPNFPVPAPGSTASVSGCAYHLDLRTKVLAAPSNATSFTEVRNWVINSRNRITQIAASLEVIKLYYSEGYVKNDSQCRNQGSAITGLTSGWARQLLTTGITTVNGTPLNLNVPTPLPSWTKPDMLSFDHTHDSHLHIALERRQ